MVTTVMRRSVSVVTAVVVCDGDGDNEEHKHGGGGGSSVTKLRMVTNEVLNPSTWTRHVANQR